MAKSTRDKNRKPLHPGALLARHAIPNSGLDKQDVAEALGISRQLLHRICAEKAPVTPNVALRLGVLFDNGPDIWFDLQSRYDMWQAAQAFDPSVVKRKVAA